MKANLMETNLIIENSFTRLEFAADHFGLTAMIDRLGRINHIPKLPAKPSLWELVFRRGRVA